MVAAVVPMNTSLPQPDASIRGDVTRLLQASVRGDSDAVSKLLPLVYGELRALAQHYMNAERADHTLDATGLVHEAYLRLVRDEALQGAERGQFFVAAADAMRRILVDYARQRGARKRGGGWLRERVDALDLSSDERLGDLLAVDEALSQLEAVDPDAARVVRLRFWAGLSVDETAQALGASPRSIDREWAFARAWLIRALQG